MKRLFITGLFLIFAACNTGKSTTDTCIPYSSKAVGEVLAKVGEYEISVKEFEERINGQSPFIRNRYQSPDKQKEFLQQQIRMEVLAQEAFRMGLHKDPEIIESVKKMMVQKLMRDKFETDQKDINITQEEIQKYYDGHIEEYKKPAKYRVAHIEFMKKEGKLSPDQLKKSKEVLAKLQKNKDDPKLFSNLAAEFSEDQTSKFAGGALAFLDEQEIATKYGPEVAKTVVALQQIGDLSQMVESPEGLHIFKLIGNRAAVDHPVDKVEKQIRNRIFREKRTDTFELYVEDLKKKANIAVYEDKLKNVKIADAKENPGGANPLDQFEQQQQQGEQTQH